MFLVATKLQRVSTALTAVCMLVACTEITPTTDRDDEPARLSIEELQNPETCKPCHARHFAEWQSSMHAYAAKDPVFTAMNERGQRQTGGQLGDFCVKCHAPMAVEVGLTRDGLNLPDLDDPNARGVTCYFCHDIDDVSEDHNRGVSLAHDGVMRGGLGPHAHAADPENVAAPHENSGHPSRYSSLHDRSDARSAALCGSCHDILNDRDVAIERTFSEWRDSPFAMDTLETCADCHMRRYAGRAAPDAPMRKLHLHMWPGVDTALTKDWPGMAAQTAAIDCAFMGVLDLELSASDREHASVQLRNRGVGHAWPSGAAQDRRAWVEVTAYDADENVIYQSGAVDEGAVVGEGDPSLEILRDRMFDGAGMPVHMFWEAESSDAHPKGYESSLLGISGFPGGTRLFDYTFPSPATRVVAQLRLQAIGLDVIDDFAGMTLPITERVIGDVYMQSGNLRSRIRTITVPGTAHRLSLGPDGQLSADDEPMREPDCSVSAYAPQP